MNKHKPIHKNYETRTDKPGHKDKHTDSSSQDDLQDLQEMDCNRYFFHQEEHYSIEDIVDRIGEEAEPYQEDFDFSNDYQQYSYSVNSSDLQRINAAYSRMMSEGCDSDHIPQPQVVFSNQISVKFFDLQRPVLQISDATQYTTSTFEQYQKPSENEENEQYDSMCV